MTKINPGRGTQKERYDRGKDRGPRGGDNVREFRPVKKVDLDACPDGYDPEVWDLTLLFRQTAAREKIDLVEFSNILLYAKMERVFSPLRKWYREKGCRKLIRVPDGPLPGFKVVRSWHDLAAATIRHRFDEYYEDEYAADRFCQPELFRDMVREVRERGLNRYVRQELDKLPDKEPEPRPRKKFKPWDGKGKRPRRLEPLDEEEL